ncbi:DUF6011 domain-containing protein [Streptomyces sp. NRRL F-5135]|uniref:DUF6011 domain-containing protein n=1 Tax=Streptomyces sp. NRRL F-5135 TaxID=1463858 RepID=UPI000568959B|nr:DUF6011 domain-containing protein [Streptomyces sp. NRRL F-5135]
MDRQEALTATPPGLRRRVWCQECGRELTDPESRRRRLGPECDPDTRTSHTRHDADQDPIPGL